MFKLVFKFNSSSFTYNPIALSHQKRKVTARKTEDNNESAMESQGPDLDGGTVIKVENR